MSEQQLLDALRAIYAALTQPKTFPADVAYARRIAEDTLLVAVQANAPSAKEVN